MKQGAIRIAAAALMCGLVSTVATPTVSSAAQVNVNVNIGAPPPVVVRERPTMVYLAEPAAYVAVGIPYDVYFVGGNYYYLHADNWYSGRNYNRPWVAVPYRTLPPGLQKYKVVRLHEFREREYVAYKSQGPAFKGKHFQAEGDNDKGNNGNGKGHGNGNGKGK